ncbi:MULTISPECIES: hypothetical protein [Arthrobacter]|uniref:Uncharacterized protein n=1 Tax=Arthrobacter bambusae TaxID=1338426 RepID=A0AAW8D7V2_9MICC|nr:MULTISPECIES: hypothetical protein [Arthrobacter]MDP9903785.1 hypothetical protein [Arthrobacter bambusae]MDQ0128220.1 hypothetical protein [Arthrobacter bambusae]MDQ0179562.1 hypothetical protein [Arthrobacter bambusae]MDQ0241299.1 hypothetical protein [Arthrobacter bambusae]
MSGTTDPAEAGLPLTARAVRRYFNVATPFPEDPVHGPGRSQIGTPGSRGFPPVPAMSFW